MKLMMLTLADVAVYNTKDLIMTEQLVNMLNDQGYQFVVACQ